MKNRQPTGYILYIGAYLDEDIVAERGLPMRNAAGSNRIRRIAEALRSTGQRVLIISPAVSMRVRWKGRLIHPPCLRTAGKVPVLFCAALGLPAVGMLLELFFLVTILRAVARRHRVAAVMLYNFSPTLLLAALWLRICWHVKIINNIEDIYMPKWADWLPGSETRPIQQLVYAGCMAAMVRLSDGIIIPTWRFASVIPSGKPYLVISGCMPSHNREADPAPSKAKRFPIHLLYAGKIEFEHGIQHLLRAVSLLSQNKVLASAFQVHICGSGSKAQWTVDYLEQFKALDIRYHGFVDDKEYKRLLSQADVCVALQDPAGRNSAYKTPSKVYEYLGHGKMVIATDVGDLALLPSEVITLCCPLNEQTLYAKLAAIVEDPERPRRQGDAAVRYSMEHFAYPVVGPMICDFIFNSTA